MVPLLSILATTLLVVYPGAFAQNSYDPYMDAAELYRMQLLANAFQYPGDKLGVESLGGGGIMDLPYGDRLSEFDDVSGPVYWPEELVAELAAAAEGENEGVGQETEVEPIAVSEDDDDSAVKEAAVEKDADKEEEKKEKQKEAKLVKDTTKYSGAQIRDQEHLEHSALHGYQSVSGGTVNGQNKQSKTDKALPAYCNPPNPCPVGKTAEENCVENFENSAENNQRLLSQQECPCDTEHMFTCPEGSQTVSSKAQGSSEASSHSAQAAAAAASEQIELNKIIADLSDANQITPLFPASSKRLSRVAKKSPHLIRKRSEDAEHGNPYLEGAKINIAAKKDSNLAKTAMHKWKTA
ncbi:7b2 precursor [Plakobranchus ocellatus]|uniref:Neuroendocrine protein 7B2 n=1 Tax=Plakobranchus ocellatus TaxID=259542 RepID=A0AAV4DLX6_9GAST|nr:7b2 precursor [Plakobranchus ocellatus]